jgi:O-acetyl-ADP-ribose deacetylase (regulator of RNase III)
MIEYVRGNILNAEADALVNTVNCVGVMGKGVALQFKQAYPENFRQYERACRANEVQPGRMLTVPIADLLRPKPKFIINFPTKRHWKGKSRLEDIETGLEALAEEVRSLAITSIAIPPLGCGNGGLDWAQVKPRIEATFKKLPDVHVLLYAPQQAPAVNTMPIATGKPRMTRSRALLIRLLEQYGALGYPLSLLEIQKLAFFLQAAGEPLKLNYVKHRYGPYAENLNHVLQKLEGHYIRGYGDRNQRAEVQLLVGATDAAQAVLARAPDAEERLDRVSRLIEGFEDPYGMELLASVLWVAREKPMVAFDLNQVIAGMQAWNERKRKVFDPDHIRKAWQRLQDEAWLTTKELVSSE